MYYRYHVYFKAELFEDAQAYAGGWYGVDYGSWTEAIEFYNWCRANDIEVELYDSEYGVSLKDDEWY